MKIAVFNTKSYDREYFNKWNFSGMHSLPYFEVTLNAATTNLTIGFEGVCVFVNDKIDREVIMKLSENGIKIIALRCAGFNNVDVSVATKYKIKVVRVPSY